MRTAITLLNFLFFLKIAECIVTLNPRTTIEIADFKDVDHSLGRSCYRNGLKLVLIVSSVINWWDDPV